MELVELLAPLGVGGILAGMMFVFYRRDHVESERRHTQSQAVLIKLVQENTEAYVALREELRRPR